MVTSHRSGGLGRGGPSPAVGVERPDRVSRGPRRTAAVPTRSRPPRPPGWIRWHHRGLSGRGARGVGHRSGSVQATRRAGRPAIAYPVDPAGDPDRFTDMAGQGRRTGCVASRPPCTRAREVRAGGHPRGATALRHGVRGLVRRTGRREDARAPRSLGSVFGGIRRSTFAAAGGSLCLERPTTRLRRRVGRSYRSASSACHARPRSSPPLRGPATNRDTNIPS